VTAVRNVQRIMPLYTVHRVQANGTACTAALGMLRPTPQKGDGDGEAAARIPLQRLRH
jgi:hypothetical protein